MILHVAIAALSWLHKNCYAICIYIVNKYAIYLQILEHNRGNLMLQSIIGYFKSIMIIYRDMLSPRVYVCSYAQPIQEFYLLAMLCCVQCS